MPFLTDTQVQTEVAALSDLTHSSGERRYGVLRTELGQGCRDTSTPPAAPGDLQGLCPSPVATAVPSTTIVRSMTFPVVPNEPFSVTVRIAGESLALGGGGAQTATSVRLALASSSLGEGPAFVAPAGYSVNSLSADIEDGHFFLPEPATSAMLASGGLLLSLLSRRRAARSA